MNEFCAEKGFAGWFETSAKENIGLDEAATFLVNKVRFCYRAAKHTRKNLISSSEAANNKLYSHCLSQVVNKFGTSCKQLC
jgi:hypothetical protein